MIPQSKEFDQSYKRFLLTIKKLKLNQLLKQSNIITSKGICVLLIFQDLLKLIFFKRNLFEMLNSKFASEMSAAKNTYYRFLSNNSYNWPRFNILLSFKIFSLMNPLTDRTKCLIVDDTVYNKSCSKMLELSAKVYDHCKHAYIRGYTLLTLGWTDGFDFIPISNNLLSSAKEENRYQGIKSDIDRRTTGYKIRMNSLLKKTEATIKLIEEALKRGITADYVLMDTWFTSEWMLGKILELGLDTISMLKNGNQLFWYNNRLCNLTTLQNLARFSNKNAHETSIVVKMHKSKLPVKIVFLRHKRNCSKMLAFITTNYLLSDQEVLRLYRNRWKIENFFKTIKSDLGLVKEFQCRDYGACVAHTSIVFARYTLLCWINRQDVDGKSIGGLIALMCDEVPDTTYAEALYSLMALLCTGELGKNNLVKSQVGYWLARQSDSVRALLDDICWES